MSKLEDLKAANKKLACALDEAQYLPLVCTAASGQHSHLSCLWPMRATKRDQTAAPDFGIM